MSRAPASRARASGVRGLLPKGAFLPRLTAWLLIVLVFTFDIAFRRREVGDKTLDFQILLKLAVWGVAGAISLFNFRGFWRNLNISLLPWTALLLMFLVSTAYSPEPLLTAISAVSLLVVLMFAITAINILGETQFIVCVILAAFLFMTASLVLYFVAPEFAKVTTQVGSEMVTRAAGFAPQPNILGRMAAFAILLSFIYRKEVSARAFWLPLLTIMVGLACLILTQSRTALIAVAIGGGLYWLLRSGRRWFVPALLVVAAGAVVVVTPDLEVLAGALARSGKATEIYTATNRIYIWRASWDAVMVKPIFGWGYSAAATVLAPYAVKVQSTNGIALFFVPHPHNALLQVLVSTGFVGGVLFVLAWAANLWGLIKAKHLKGLAILVYWTITGVTELAGFTGVASTGTLAMFLPLALICAPKLSAKPQKRRRRRSKPEDAAPPQDAATSPQSPPSFGIQDL